MPPKKAKPRATIKSDYLATVTSDDSGLDSSSGPHQLTSEQLSRAYGLAPPPPNSPEYSLLLRSCPPKWSNGASPEQEKRSSPEVITINSDDEDPPKELKNLKRGSKGKGKADDDHACSAEHCSNNPRCLNWLGQDKWERSSEFARATRRFSARSCARKHSHRPQELLQGSGTRHRPLQRPREGHPRRLARALIASSRAMQC